MGPCSYFEPTTGITNGYNPRATSLGQKLLVSRIVLTVLFEVVKNYLLVFTFMSRLGIAFGIY
jgi:hypothetical protein